MIRSCVLFVVAVLLLASCGFTRTDASLVEPFGPPPTVLAPAIELPSKGPDDAVAASIDFGDDDVVEITFGEVDEIVQPSLASDQYRVLGGLSPTFDTQILNLLIFSRLMGAELAAQELTVSDSDRAESSEALVSEVSALLSEEVGDPTTDRTELAEQLFEDVPHLQLIVEAQAQQTVLINHFSETATPEDVPCVSHILLDSEEPAIAVVEALDEGGDFSELAAENSIDQVTNQSGGALGCARPADFIEPGFVEAVTDAEVGVVTGPVETTQGWHVILITELDREIITPEALGGREFEAVLEERLTTANIDVDEAIGTWDQEASQLVPATP